MVDDLRPYWGPRWVGGRGERSLFAVGFGDWELCVLWPFGLVVRQTTNPMRWPERSLRWYSPWNVAYRCCGRVPDDMKGRWFFWINE